MEKIGIILVNYKDYARRFLAPCRDSLRAQDYPASLFQVYIVDNASTPESQEYLRSAYPEAVVIPRPDGNYAAANNAGFRQAQADGCCYLVSANMDTEMAPAWLSELALALDRNPEAAAAQSKILLFPKTEEEKAHPLINSLGNRLHFFGFGFTSAYGEPDREIAGYPEITGYPSGCSFIVRAEDFTAVGGYDEEYYMYHDDLELGLKLRLAGRKLVLAPRSVIFHKYEFSRSTKMVYYMERNRYLTLLAFYPAGLLIIFFIPLLLGALAVSFYSIIHGWFRENLRVAAYFFDPRTYALVSKWRQERRTWQKVRFSKVASSFADRIEFKEVANPFLRYVANPLMSVFWKIAKVFA